MVQLDVRQVVEVYVPVYLMIFFAVSSCDVLSVSFFGISSYGALQAAGPW